jgi:hypothetical protein
MAVSKGKTLGISVIVISVLIVAVMYLPFIFPEEEEGWFEKELVDDLHAERVNLEIVGLHDAELNIRFTQNPSLVYSITYFASNDYDITEVNAVPQTGAPTLRCSVNVEVLNVTLGSDIAYELVVDESENLTTTIVFDENSLMDGSWLGYGVQGGSLDILMTNQTNFQGTEMSRLSMFDEAPMQPDMVNLNITLPNHVGGYGHLRSTASIDLVRNGWDSGISVVDPYLGPADYATTERSGYLFGIAVNCPLITGFLG